MRKLRCVVSFFCLSCCSFTGLGWQQHGSRGMTAVIAAYMDGWCAAAVLGVPSPIFEPS